jgi:glycerol kinase
MEVEHSQSPETTGLGAAFISGLSTGFWNSKKELKDLRKVDKIYKPEISKEEREEKYRCWKEIVNRSLKYYF